MTAQVSVGEPAYSTTIILTQEGAGGVSDPESRSVSSSQHSSSWDEGARDVITPHMKFASDISALDKRDKELVSVYIHILSMHTNMYVSCVPPAREAS